VLYACKGAGVLSLSVHLSSLSLYLSLTGKEGMCGHALCLQGCAHSLHWSERERERERERDKEGGGEERDEEYVQNFYFYFLKGMAGRLRKRDSQMVKQIRRKTDGQTSRKT
jgi:hypothetical protein